MTDESKVWLARIAFWVTSTIDTTLLIKVAADAGKSGIPIGWTILLLLVTGVTVYNWLLLRRYKANRGKQAVSSLNQIEVEALAAYGADILKKQQGQAQPLASQKESPEKPKTTN